ncbi:MAG: hypothetical protein DWH91_11645 [Planctomycetota bacterium]|nr:MAG: hypothetical protein DWH91_11645 [Planctomycetota bacterium]
MKTAVRMILSLIAGIGVALILVIAVELISAVIHPVPPGFQGTMDEMCQHVAQYPHWVLGLVVPAWGGTAFLGTWVARKLGNRSSGVIVGLLLLAAVICNVTQLPYAIWFKVVILLVIPVAVLRGLREPRHSSPPVE